MLRRPPCPPWAAQCNTGLLSKLTPKGVLFSFLFLSFFWGDHLVVLQMYARKLGECLLRLSDDEEDHEAAAADLHRWIP